MAGSVTISEDGRSGRVQYSEGLRAIDGYFEFGGGDVVAIVSMGSGEDWRRTHGWAADERARILQRVAEEVIRQRAPSCVAEIDDERGDIVLRAARDQSSTASAPSSAARAKAADFVHRFTDLKARLGAGVLAVTVIVGALMWFGTKAFTVEPASGVPLGEAVRFESSDASRSGGIASLIQKTDPHLPRWSGRGGNETTSVSLLVIPVDGSRPRLVSVASRLTPGSYSLARIMGSDGRTLWFDVVGLYGVRLSDVRLVTPKDLRAANPTLDPTWWDDPRGMDIVEGKLRIVRGDRSAAVALDPATWVAASAPPVSSNARFARRAPTDYLAAGVRIAPNAWLGVHSTSELARRFSAGRWLRPVESADDAREMRRLCRADLSSASDDSHRRIRSIAPTGDAAFLNAAFLRLDDTSEPLRLNNPDSVLMIHTSAPGLSGTLVMSRVNAQGDVLWSVDTGVDRFRLQQILPGAEVFAFVGSRPPIPDKLSEPMVVLVETRTGKMTSQSLWR